MQETVKEYMQINDRIRGMEEQLDGLKSYRKEIGDEIIKHVTGKNLERLDIGPYDVKIQYYRRYSHDVGVIRGILEPIGVFEEMSRIYVNQAKLDRFLLKEKELSDQQYEALVNSIHIVKVKELLKVTENGRI